MSSRKMFFDVFTLIFFDISYKKKSEIKFRDEATLKLKFIFFTIKQHKSSQKRLLISKRKKRRKRHFESFPPFNFYLFT